MSAAATLPAALIPELLELERSPPAEPAAFIAAALDPAAPAAPSSVAAAEVLRFAAREGLSPPELHAVLRASGMGESLAACFSDYLATHPSLRALLQTTAAGPPLTLVDVDWTFGVSASSSELPAMGTTFVQLRLHTRGADGALQFVHAELDLAHFYSLLHDLEQAKARLELM